VSDAHVRGQWWLLIKIGDHWLRWEGPFDWRSGAQEERRKLIWGTTVRELDLKVQNLAMQKQRHAA